MKYTTVLLSTVLIAALAGCALQSRQTGTTVPTGPIQANTTEPGVLPAGTTLAIRTTQTIETRQAGQTYSAEVAESVEDQAGKILVSKGSPAELIVLQASSGGTLGTPTLALTVRSITVNRRTYAVSTAANEQSGREGLGQNRRTAGMVGGGALLGTIIGAAAGGGKGAVVGAVAGAAAGATGQILTRGNEVRVPAETILTFRLDQPWQMKV